MVYSGVSMIPLEDLPPEFAGISAHSERQAMDWSLVLASQEIEATILREPGASRWRLQIPAVDHARALAAIRQYRLENRGFAWRHELPGSQLDVHIGALIWSVYLAAFFFLTSLVYPELSRLGAMNNVAVAKGAWWKLFTPILLHADIAHLAANLVFGSLILGLAMARFGPGIALLATFLAGALGNVAGFLFYSKEYYGVGASGMMMGALGLLCVHSIGLWRKGRKAAKYILSGVVSGAFLFITFGTTPGSDILAHSGGFFGGLLFGSGLGFAPEKKLQNRPLNLAALMILAALIVTTWSLVLLK